MTARYPSVRWGRSATSLMCAAALSIVSASSVGATALAPGTMTPNPAIVTAGAAVSPLTLTYLNNSSSTFTGNAMVNVPTGWTAPQFTQPANPGYAAISSSGCGTAAVVGVSGRTVQIGIECLAGQGFDLAYMGNAPTVAGTYRFKTALRALDSSTAQPIQIQPAVKVKPGPLDHLVLSPASSSTPAGTPITYTATGKDSFGNSIGNVTKATKFTITPGGPCAGAACGATHPGTYSVLGLDGSAAGTASLAVTVGPVSHLVLSPNPATTSNGVPVSYAAEGFDAFGNDAGSVTGTTTFSLAPDGSCVGASCTASTSGSHTVTGADGSATGTATLTVVAGPAIGGFTASASTISDGASVNLTPSFSGGTGVITDNQGDGIQLLATSGAAISLIPPTDVATTYTLTVTGAGGATATASAEVTSVARPVVTDFAGSPAIITSGDSTTLSVTFTGGTLQITPNATVTSVSGNTETFAASPLASTSYTATVANAAGAQAQGSATITVVAPPVWSGFTASPWIVTIGSATTLTPTFSNGRGVVTDSVESGQWPVTSGSALTVTPTVLGTEFYSLTVTNAAGTSAVISTGVQVVGPPVIISFTASQPFVTDGGSATLNASFANFGPYPTLSVNSSLYAAFPSSPARLVADPFPNQTTTYTLSVTNDAGDTVSESVTVTAVPPPSITTFTVGPSSISNGGTVEFTVLCSAGSTAVIFNNQDASQIPLPPCGSPYYPGASPPANASTVYTLVVTNQAGTTVARSVTVLSS